MVHIPIVSRLSFGDYKSIIFTFIILGIETCFRLVAYLIPGVILDAGKALVEKYALLFFVVIGDREREREETLVSCECKRERAEKKED